MIDEREESKEMMYELVNDAYGNENQEVTIDELQSLLTDVFGDTETELVERDDGIYEVASGDLVARVIRPIVEKAAWMTLKVWARPLDVDQEGFGASRDRYLGQVNCDTVARGLQLFESQLDPDEAEELVYQDVTASEAARALGSIKSEKKAAASRENGKKGGRPKGSKKEAGK